MPVNWGGDAGPQISSALEALGRARAEQAERQGAIWGGALNNLGQLVAQAPVRAALEQERQARALELQGIAQQRQLQAKQLADAQAGEQALAQAINDPANGGDTQKIYQAVSKTHPEVASHYLDLATKHQEALDKLQSYANAQYQTAADVLGAVDATDPQQVKNGLGLLKTKGLPQPLLDQLAQSMDTLGPEQAIQTLVRTAPKNVESARKIAEETAVAQAKGEGQHVINGQLVSSTGQPIGAQVPPQVNPNEAAAQAETARHNSANEAIEKLKVGREAAAQAETARHNRAMELANNPLAALQGAGGAAGATDATVGNPTGQAVLDKLPTPIAAQVKALAEGRMAFPSGFALKSPYWQSMITLVSQYDPSFDAINYNARSKTRNDFTSGKSAQQVNALNTVIGHLDDLNSKVDDLGTFHSGTFGPLTGLANEAKTAYQRGTGSAKLRAFETNKKAVADEVTRVWRQAGGSEKDIEAAQSNLSAASSPEELHSAVTEFAHLLGSKLDAFQNQYEQGMGTAGVQMLAPESRARLERLRGAAAAPTPSGGFRVVGSRPVEAK